MIRTYFMYMTVFMSYSQARAGLASLWDRVEETGEVAVLRRRGHRDVAVIRADELAALEETADLLRSPNTALRLLTALNRALGESGEPTQLAELLSELGFDGGERK